LQAIIAVGFKIENERAVQFRKWANQIVKDYTIQGWVMDVERLKSGGSVLTKAFFERQLEKIREIRLSERKFYQKITDLYATALDYDPSAAAAQRFFAVVQNKLHFAIHGQTAAEVIVDRADHQKEHMGLLWERDVLQDAGKVSAELARAHAETEFEKYRVVQDRLFESDFDRLLKRLEENGQKGDEA
ncbi:MAG: virulence RhuM family protein, partial [Zoogloeaceae bacterium]|nr:virulence RhuM family protein [Zoogloeaceae bacterium]